MADLTASTQRLLRHGRVHEVGRHEAARPQDVRGEYADGREVRHEEPHHRVLTSAATGRRAGGRRVREWLHRAVRAASQRATWQRHLVDGWWRADRLVS